jgi:Icc-related predicted phosphoesterase
LRIWGTPWQPWFYNWGFNAPKRGGEAFLRDKFSAIPKETDIIICHGPPHGLGDHEVEGMYEHYGYGDTPARSGSRALGAAMRRVNPKLLVCGHIHQGYGTYEVSGKQTTVVNAAIVNYEYQPVNEPVVLDV